VTAVELHDRLARVRPDVEVVGLEIDPERVAQAAGAARPGLTFALGGFEVPLAGRSATVIRAFNVLRQYDERSVVEHWTRMVVRLAPGGGLVEGTCDEVGRVGAWVDVAADGPVTLTLSLRLSGLERPSIVAERLPKALIHRNVPGEGVHALLAELDRQWAVAAPLSTFSPSQRWIAAVEGVRDAGWPVLGGRSRWRLGELTVEWSAVAPSGFVW
jgi:hypothetical protein